PSPQPLSPNLHPQMREKDHIPDRVIVGKHHRQAVNPHAETTIRWHAITHGSQVVLVHGIGFIITHLRANAFFDEALLLVEWIIQFAKGITDLDATHKPLKPLDRARIAEFTLG